jgi:PAS domain-containing protein
MSFSEKHVLADRNVNRLGRAMPPVDISCSIATENGIGPRMEQLARSPIKAGVVALRHLRSRSNTVISHCKSRVLCDVLVTLLLVAIASGVRVLLSPVLYDRASFLLFALAVMLSAWIGGLRMGLLATVLAGVAGAWLFIRPFDKANMHDIQDASQALLFGLTGCGISFLAGEMHAARLASEKQAGIATRSRDELAELVESIREGFQAFDRNYRLTFMNGAAERILRRSKAELAGQPVWGQFPAIIGPDVEHLLRRAMVERRPASCESFYEPWGRWFAINVYPFRDGISVLFRDVSERQKGQQEREGLIAELQRALSNVRTLHGLIPICASCKRIRDDHGYWRQLEVYIREHSDADFSHGMCPECAEKYFQA